MMCYCCYNCFKNLSIKKYIIENSDMIGDCLYCGSRNVNLISTRKLGIYMSGCIEKGYETKDEGTGAMYDSEEDLYIGRNGNEVISYTIMEILTEEEDVFSDNIDERTLAKDLFSEIVSYEDLKDGVPDIYGDIDADYFVVRDDLYGLDITKVYQSWITFKHIVLHYNRFFEINQRDSKEKYLEIINRYLYDFITDIDIGEKFYRVRELDKSLENLEKIDKYKEMGPAPYKYSKTNRMSPAGISYLYLAGDKETAYAECRLNGKKAIVAEFQTKEVLQIIDFSRKDFILKSIFDENYEHDDKWISDFLNEFVDEITKPVDENVKDHSYEYAATQIVAEFLRSKNYDGICFESSVCNGKSYVFFYGPDPEHDMEAYPYPFGDPFLTDILPTLEPYTSVFDIVGIEQINISAADKNGY